MALNAAILGYEYFPDPTKGRPVYFGSIYIGLVDLDPQIPANQLTIQYRQEDGTLVPAVQPVVTGAGGVPLYNGSPVQIVVDGAYSIKVLNSSGVQVYYRADSSDNSREIITPLDTLTELRANTDSTLLRVSLTGHTTEGDGGGSEFWLDTSDTTTADDNGLYIVDSVSPRIGTWKRLVDGLTNFSQFGGVGDGVTDSTASYNTIKAQDDTFIMPKGSYLIDGVVRDISESAAVETADGLPVDRTPFFVMISGQSNAKGTSNVPGSERPATGNSIGIEDGVFAWSYSTNRWVKPVWGSNPLASSGSNNAGIEFANEIKRLTGRDVYVFVNAAGGMSIKNWVENGVNSIYWADESAGGSDFSVLTQLNDAGIDRLDAILWMQGEADHNGREPGYDTYAEYKTALGTLVDQYWGLTQAREFTQFLTSGVGEWAGMTGWGRNDVLLALNEDPNPQLGNISTNGTTYNPDEGAASSHFDFYSLRLIGRRFARKYLGMNVGDVTVYTGINGYQGARLPFNGTFIDDGSVIIDPQDIKGGAYYQVSNTDFTLPDPDRFDGATVVFNITTNDASDNVTITTAGSENIIIQGQTSIGATSIDCFTAGEWVFRAMNGRLHLISRPYVQTLINDLELDGGTLNVTVDKCDNGVVRSTGGNLNLPDPASLTGLQLSVHQATVANGNTVIGITGGATSKFVDKSAVVASSITMTAQQHHVRLLACNTRWTVIWQNF